MRYRIYPTRASIMYGMIRENRVIIWVYNEKILMTKLKAVTKDMLLIHVYMPTKYSEDQLEEAYDN